MVATSSFKKKIFGLSKKQVINLKKLMNAVRSYVSQLDFPSPDSDEFKILSVPLQNKIRKFEEGPENDFLQWMESFAEKHSVTTQTKYIKVQEPLMFVKKFLLHVLDEMQETGLAIIEEMARSGNNYDDDEDD